MATPYTANPIYLSPAPLAASDLSTKQGYAVTLDSSGNAIVQTTTGGNVLGILQNKPTTSTNALIVTGGVVPMVAGGTVAINDLIKCDSNGKGVAAQAAYVNTSDAGSAQDPVVGSYVIGRALSAASSGEQFNLLIEKMGAVPTTAA
jgi:hypothetical protein